MTRIAAGDRGAFSELMNRHQSAVFRFAQSIARTGADAEDALQEAFLNAWRSASSFRSEASVRTWLLAIARNAVLRMNRRKADEPERMDSLDELAEAAGWGDETPEALALSQEGRDLIAIALRQLDSLDREILVLRDLEELPGEEVARILGIGLAAMKTRLHRARLKLAAKVRQSYAR